MRLGILIGLTAIGTAGALHAQSTVQLTRSVFVERFAPGSSERTLQPASNLRKGDTIVLMVKWRSTDKDGAFTVSSPIPRTLQYKRSSNNQQTVSVDGGKKWGTIGSLKIQDGNRQRIASVEDVTHLRWRISARTAARGKGQVTYSAIVR